LLFATIPELIVETQFGSVTYRIWWKTAELRRKRWTINSFFQSPESLTEIKLFSLTKHFIDKAAAFFWEFAHQEADAEKKEDKTFAFDNHNCSVMSRSNCILYAWRCSWWRFKDRYICFCFLIDTSLSESTFQSLWNGSKTSGR
jgi:hypothetical protein